MFVVPQKITRLKPLHYYWLFGFVLVVGLVVSLFAGAAHLPASVAIQALTFQGGDQFSQVIIWQVRMPRVLLSGFVGSVLAVSGAVMQGLFRNPLADPSLIGVSAGSALGAALVIVLGAQFELAMLGFLGLSLTSIGAFIGALLSVTLVYRLATGVTGTSVTTMLLLGIAISALSGAGTGFLEFYADNTMLRRISLWRMGGTAGADYYHVLIVLLLFVGLVCYLPGYARSLNVFLLGESEARHLGINVQATKRHLVIAVAAAVGTSMALVGNIVFVGLVAPHLVRLLVGPNHRHLLPLSALLGAILLVLADALARSLLAPTELPMGLLTALLGAPFFIVLLRLRHQYGMR